MQFVKSLSNSLLLSGGITALIGLYFIVAKAGIPYQDAPPELVGRYTAFQESGEICLAIAGMIILAGIVGHIIRSVAGRQCERHLES